MNSISQSKPISSFKRFTLERIVLIISMIFTIMTVTYFFTNFKNEEFKVLHKFVPNKWNFETKISLLSIISSWVGMLILFVMLYIASLRVITDNASPIGNQDSESIVFLNRILTNTVEQTLIFLPNLACWTINYANEGNKHEVVAFGVLWMVGRVIFIIGYFIGLKIDFQILRGFGLGLSVISSFILVVRNLGFRLV